MAEVCILLSTYNGERYLERQLNTLLSQTYQDFVILIRDDGSKDSTVDVLNRYAGEYPDKIKILYSDRNLGYPDCFWELLEKAPSAKYYSFCDQDDIWYETKLERAVRKLKNVDSDASVCADSNCDTNVDDCIACDCAVPGNRGQDIPCIYYHAYDICYDDGDVVDTYRPGDISTIPIEKQFFYTYTMGYTIVLNDSMRSLLLSQKPQGRVLAHDVWTLFNAYYNGRIVYDDMPQACYRRHSNSVTSAGKGVLSLIDSWIKKEILGGECEKTRNRLTLFLEACGDSITPEDIVKFKLFGIKGGLGSYFKKLFYPHRLKDSWGGELAIRILFLLNR